MGDGTSKTGPVLVQGLAVEPTFDPAGHDHSKTILLQGLPANDTPIKSVGNAGKDGFNDSIYDASTEGGESPYRDDSIGLLDGIESPSMNRQGMPDDTVIIFDWDDTLLCSSAINMNRWNHTHLEVLQAAVESVLRLASRLGEVLIVTNGVDWWVDDSARRFLPSLLPLLGTITVKSARAVWERKYPGDPFAWKREAFRELLAPRSRSINLVVLGDSLAEIEAANGVTPLLWEGSMVKTVKFKEAPSADQVIGQLRSVEAELAEIVQERGSLARELVQRPIPEQLLTMVGSSGWRLKDVEGSITLDA
jgi:hypothetical protein